MDSLSPQVVSTTKLPILNPNEFDLWKMRIEQYFLMTDYSLWEVIMNGDSHVPTRVVKGVLQPVAPTTVEQSLPSEWKTYILIWRNKADLEEQSLDDLFYSLKIYKTEVKQSSSTSTASQNLAFVSSSHTDNIPVSAAMPKINVTRPRYAHHVVTKSKSPIRRHITRSLSSNTSNSPLRVTAVKAPVVSAAQGMQGQWGNTQHALKDKGVINSGCSRYKIGNMSYLSDFEELNRGYVSFEGNPKGGKITGKGKIKT
nr:hypothetical protein [Tanacetum cinerariifolium]